MLRTADDLAVGKLDIPLVDAAGNTSPRRPPLPLVEELARAGPVDVEVRGGTHPDQRGRDGVGEVGLARVAEEEEEGRVEEDEEEEERDEEVGELGAGEVDLEGLDFELRVNR